MKKVKFNKVSLGKIKKIAQYEIAEKAQAMSEAIFGAPLTFKAPFPFTAVAFALLISTYLSTQAAYQLGGKLKRSAFLAAKNALYGGVLAFAPYVNGIALGDIEILKLSTLPLLTAGIDYAALIAAGATVQHIIAIQGKVQRQITTTCPSFGEKIGYTVIVSEGVPLPPGFQLTPDGSFFAPTGIKCIVNWFGNRNKVFSNLLPKTEYYVYYVLSCQNVIGVLSFGKSIVTSA